MPEESSNTGQLALIALGALAVGSYIWRGKVKKRRERKIHRLGSQEAADTLAMRHAARAEESIDDLLAKFRSAQARNEYLPDRTLGTFEAQIQTLLDKSSEGDDLWSPAAKGAYAAAAARFETVRGMIAKHNAAMEVEDKAEFLAEDEAKLKVIDAALLMGANTFTSGAQLSELHEQLDTPMLLLRDRAEYLAAHSGGELKLVKQSGQWWLRRVS